MAHFAKPFFRKDRGLWYVQIHGKQHNLGRNKEEAFKKYHALMQRPVPVESELVVGIIEGFLDWAETHREPETVKGYKKFLQSFVVSLADPKKFTVEQLKPFHVQQWVDSKPKWGPTYCHNAITAVKRCFSWAEKLGHIARSPIRAVEKPTPERRKQLIPDKEYETMIASVRGQTSRDLLVFLHESGCRPEEFRIIEARHYNEPERRIEIPPEEAKGRKRWRRIYLSEKTNEIVARLSKRHPTGPIFRNEDGSVWTVFAIDCLFKRLESKVGKKYSAYDMRHTWATRMLVSGLDHLTVAELLGHANGATLAKVYAHVDQKADYLREKFNQALNGEA
jgi:integrase